MMLLETLEGHLGTIDCWLSYIMRYIFSDRPSPVAAVGLKKGMTSPASWPAGSIRLVTERHIDRWRYLDLWANGLTRGTMYG